MKKILCMLLTMVLCIGLACSAFAAEQSVPAIGIGIDIPDDVYDQNIAIMQLDEGSDVVGLDIYYLDYSVYLPIAQAYADAYQSGDTQAAQEQMTKLSEVQDSIMAQLGVVMGLKTDSLDALKSEYGIDDTCVLLGENSTHTYYYSINRDDFGQLSDENQEAAKNAIPTVEAMIASVTLSDIQDNDDVISSGVASFSTVDMDGNTVTEEIFNQKDLTIVNLWGTYCNPCINEMPELAQWATELPDNVQLIGMVIDVSSASDSTFSTAQKIIRKTGVGYTNLLVNSSLSDMLSGVVGVPTTLFIDRNGNAVHDPVVGAYVDQYKQVVNDYLAEHQ